MPKERSFNDQRDHTGDQMLVEVSEKGEDAGEGNWETSGCQEISADPALNESSMDN